MGQARIVPCLDQYLAELRLLTAERRLRHRRSVLTLGDRQRKCTMPTPDPDRLRTALDQLANGLQPATLVAGRLRRASAGAAEDAAAVDETLTRVVTILKAVQTKRPE